MDRWMDERGTYHPIYPPPNINQPPFPPSNHPTPPQPPPTPDTKQTKQYIGLNATLAALPLTLSYSPMSLQRWQLMNVRCVSIA